MRFLGSFEPLLGGDKIALLEGEDTEVGLGRANSSDHPHSRASARFSSKSRRALSNRPRYRLTFPMRFRAWISERSSVCVLDAPDCLSVSTDSTVSIASSSATSVLTAGVQRLALAQLGLNANLDDIVVVATLLDGFFEARSAVSYSPISMRSRPISHRSCALSLPCLSSVCRACSQCDSARL